MSGSFLIGTSGSGIFIKAMYLDHSSRLDHTLNGSFTVSQPRQGYVDDIICYVFTEEQFHNWMKRCFESNSYYINPTETVFKTGQVKEGNFRLPVIGNGIVYFVLDNRYSTYTSKQVSLALFEEWTEQDVPPNIHTTVPPEDESLKNEFERLIADSKESLKIISPYVDMTVINKLLQKKSKGVIIQIILRNDPEIKGLAKDGLIQIQSQFPESYRIHPDVHSRILIRDNFEALISSADLTQKSLQGQFNLGITVSDPDLIKKTTDYFDTLWLKSRNPNIKK
ncbi:MAG: phospholipase D family protein [Thaumarchaeota archaeon]|nr:phospholipase D family protein [Nitrososphaerota archaeon]